MPRYKPMHPLRRIAKVIRDIEQILRDCESWNDNATCRNGDHPAPPIDTGNLKVSLACARRVQRALTHNDQAAYQREHARLTEVLQQEWPAT